MIPPDPFPPLVHGGDLDAARRLFPGAPEPFLDLSTGINPNPYPVPQLAAESWTTLPAQGGISGLAQCGAAAYGAPSKTNVVPAPGSQILMTLLVRSVRPGRAAILGPTYAEHARAAALAGHETTTVCELDDLSEADLAIVVNPNNPDGRLLAQDRLLDLTRRRPRDGLLILDEAFMDASAGAESLCSRVEDTNVVVLRSFGKFFGLAGLRLSFAVAAGGLASRLAADLGPWPVSGAALTIGSRALSDAEWIARTRQDLREASLRLDTLLGEAGLEKVGGTPLFSLVRSPDAPRIFDRLGQSGIVVRRFIEEPSWLRFGLPGGEDAWRRLEVALRA